MIKDLLKSSSVFNGINSRDLGKIEMFGKMVEFRDGDIIFTAGDNAEFIYIVRKGEAQLKFSINLLNATSTLTMDTIKEKGHLGWSAFTKPYKYTLSAVAKGDTQLLQLQSEKIRALCDHNKNLGYIVMQNIATLISIRFARLQGLLQHVMQGYLN